jgi:hypothetical protein
MPTHSAIVLLRARRESVVEVKIKQLVRKRQGQRFSHKLQRYHT